MKKLLIAVMFVSLLVGCAGKSHQQRVDTISNGMDKFNSAYAAVENALIAAHESDPPLISGAPWNKVVTIRETVAPLAVRLNENWKLVPQTDASIEAFILQPDFQTTLKLALRLSEIAEENGITVTDALEALLSLKRGDQ
jgi:hypothetical protein